MRLVSRRCQHFLDAFEGGKRCRGSGMVTVVIISFLWSLRLRTQKRAGPGLLLHSLGVPKSSPVQPDVSLSLALGFLPGVLRPVLRHDGFWGPGPGVWVGLLSGNEKALHICHLRGHRAEPVAVFLDHLRSDFSSGMRGIKSLPSIELFTKLRRNLGG